MAKKIGVILAGCGHRDGSEIHEATLTLLYLDTAGVKWQALAPDRDQYHVLDHITGEPMDESRNMLVESARIARGNIVDIAKAKPDDFDALIFPGGFGAAKNLLDWAFKGAQGDFIDDDVSRLVKAMHTAKKPIGFICIAPVIPARIFAGTDIHPKLTIGTDIDTADAMRSIGATPEKKMVDEITIDEENRFVTTPAYMLGPGISDIARGIEKLVNTVIEMS